MASELFYFMRKNGVDLLKYLPRFLAADSTFKDTHDVLSREHENLRVKLADFAKQFFIDTATWSMADWENFTGVKRFRNNLEARRLRVKAKLLGGEVMTVANTNALIRSFTDGKLSFADETAGANKLKIVLLDRVLYWEELFDSLFELLPAHLWFEFERRIEQRLKLFAGTADAQVGTKIIGLERPHDERINLYAGAGNGVFGWRSVGLGMPESPPPNNLHLGQVDIKSGTIWAHADLSDLYKIPYIAENGTVEIFIVDVGIVRPSDVPKKIERVANHIGQIYFRNGFIKIGADMDDLNRIPREDEHVVNHIGQVLVRRGEITIGADMSDVGLEHVVNHVGNIIVKQGEITIPTGDRNIPLRVINHVGQMNVRSGFMRIHADLSDVAKHNWIKEHGTANILVADIGIARPMSFRYVPVDPVEPDEALPNGLWLRNYFDFPTGEDHPVLLENPRDDLTVADIKAVGDYAAANNLLFNSKAEGTLGIRKASLIRGYDMLTADDSDVFPTQGKARLFFDFPNGNHRKIQLQNRRSDLTVGDVKAFGATTTTNRILTNAHGEHSTGLTRVNIIRDFKINSLPPTTPITFEEDDQ